MDLPAINPTVIAATVAAIASLLNLFFNIITQRKSEIRAAHRKSLESNYNKIGQLLHQSIAIPDIVGKRMAKNLEIKEWLLSNTKIKKELEECRKQVRYPLWGLDEGLRTLVRITNWVTLCKNIPERIPCLLKAADELRIEIDKAIIKSYQTGKRPSYFSRRKVNKKIKKLKKVYSENRRINLDYKKKIDQRNGG